MSKDPKTMTDKEKQERVMEIANKKFEGLTNDGRTADMQEILGLVKGAILIVEIDEGPPGTIGVCVMNNRANATLRIGAARALMENVTQQLARNLPEPLVDRLMEQILGKDGNPRDALKELLKNDELMNLLDNDRKTHDDFDNLPKPSGRFNFNHDD